MAEAVVGDWVPLMDYAIKRGVSLSTLRRYIKSNKIKYRVEEGRYLLWDDGAALALGPGGRPTHLGREIKPADKIVAAPPQLQTKIKKLETELGRAKEEISELKMLIAIYEEKIGPSRSG